MITPTPLVVPNDTLAAVAAEAATCLKCPLGYTRTKSVFGEGNPHAKLVFIGEAPGENEDLSGKPFVGRAGQLLTQMLEQIGLTRQDHYYITNTLKCRPPGNRTPEPDETNACQDYLRRQLAILDPDIIVLVGSTAFNWMFQEKIGISKIRGKWLCSPGLRAKIMPIFHPSYLLRQHQTTPGSPRALTMEDLENVKQQLAVGV